MGIFKGILQNTLSIFFWVQLIIFLVLSSCWLVHASSAGNEETAVPGKVETKEKEKEDRERYHIEASYYFDNRDYNTLNIETSIKDLPLGTHIWGFTDIHGNQNDGSRRFDFTRYFMEYRLGGAIGPNEIFGLKGLGWEAEFNDFNGPKNQVFRFGLTYKHSVPWLHGDSSWIQWRFHPYQTDEAGMQASFIYKFILSEKIFISGFADFNMRKKGSNRWITEPQLNYILNDSIDLVFEGRINQFEGAANSLDGSGVAAGIKVKF